MTLLVFFLVFVSASIHVAWNTLVKKSDNKLSFAWLTTVVGGFVFLPIFIYYRIVNPGPLTLEVWGWAALSGLLESIYVVLLFGAYGKADLSVVYPLSRGVAPVLTLFLGGRILGDYVDFSGAASVMVIVAGVVMVSLSAWTAPGSREAKIKGIWLALATGAAIAGYHLVDRRAMSLPNPPNAQEYIFLMQLFMAVYITIWALIKSGGNRELLFCEWRVNLRSVMLVGFATPIAYFLIIFALKFGNVTHIAAGRNIGIFLSTMVGALFLKESVTRLRLLGVILIVTGVVALVICQEC